MRPDPRVPTPEPNNRRGANRPKAVSRPPDTIVNSAETSAILREGCKEVRTHANNKWQAPYTTLCRGNVLNRLKVDWQIIEEDKEGSAKTGPEFVSIPHINKTMKLTRT